MLKKIYLLLFLPVLLLSCNGSGKTSENYFDKEIYKPRYAKGFDIRGREGAESVVVGVRNPWQGAEGVEKELLIVRGGEAVPDNFEGQVLQGDAARIVAMSSTQIAMLEAVGEEGRVVGVSGLDYISSPGIQRNRDKIADIGYEGNVDYEQLLSLRPDIVLLFGTTSASNMEGKLQELGIPYLYVGEYLEESPLGKAEWLVALAEIAGKGSRGQQVFSHIPLRYNELKDKVAQSGAPRPKVMLNTPWSDIWNMPSVTSYLPQLIADAGGQYVYTKDTGNSSLPIDIEEAYLLASDADYWLNVGQAASLAELAAMCPKFTDTRCFADKKVYNNNARLNAGGGNDFFEGAVVHPDIVLRDLVKIFHPELVDVGLVYYKALE